MSGITPEADYGRNGKTDVNVAGSKEMAPTTLQRLGPKTLITVSPARQIPRAVICRSRVKTLGSPANFKFFLFHASNTSTTIDRAVRTVENEKDKIFLSLMDVGKRCLVRDEICRFYYRGYYYETPGGLRPRSIVCEKSANRCTENIGRQASLHKRPVHLIN